MTQYVGLDVSLKETKLHVLDEAGNRVCKTLGGHILEHPSCGGFMPTAETTLIPASSIKQRASKKSLTGNARLDNEPNLLNDFRFRR